MRMRRDYWRQLDEIEAQLIQLIEETERLAREARSALAGLPALRDDFDAYLAWRISAWEVYVRQLVVDLLEDVEAEAKAGSSSALEDQRKAGVPSHMEVGRDG